MTRRGWVLFALMSVLWGIPYLLIKIAVEELSPATLVFLRTGIGAAILLPWAAWRGYLRPLLPYWRPVLAFTVLELTGPWLLLADAEQQLSSSFTGLLIAGVPMVAAVAARLAGQDERLSRERLVGLGIGLAGVVLLLGIDVRGTSAVAVAEVGLVALGYATAPLVANRYLGQVSSIGVTAAALGLTAVFYLPFAVVSRPDPLLPSARVISAVLILAVLCTAVAMVLFFALIAEVGPQRALVITFVNPAVALVAGIVVLDERLTLGAALGFPVVLLGSVLATRRTRPPAARDPLPEPLTAP